MGESHSDPVCTDFHCNVRNLSGTDMTGRPGYRTMEMIGGSSAPYLARTPCVPLFCTSFNRVGNKERFRLPGAGGGSFPLYGGTFARSYSVSNLHGHCSGKICTEGSYNKAAGVHLVLGWVSVPLFHLPWLVSEFRSKDGGQLGCLCVRPGAPSMCSLHLSSYLQQLS